MENKQLSDNKITYCIDARNANESWWESLDGFVSKTKQDIEVICIISSKKSSNNSKIITHNWDNTKTTAGNFSDALLLASGSLSVCLWESIGGLGNISQQIQTQKKLLNLQTLSTGSFQLITKGSKVKAPVTDKIYNSLTRIFTSIKGSDCNSGIIAANTHWLIQKLSSDLVAANSYLQLLNLVASYKIKSQEFAINSLENKPNYNWINLVPSLFSLRWNYFITDAKLQFKLTDQKLGSGNHPLYRMLYFVFFVLISFAMPFLSQDFGSTWDEKAHNDYSQLAYRYLTTFGEDTAALAEPANGGEYIRQAYRFYGEQLNTIAAFTYNTFGTGVYETRHLINSLYGLIGIIFTSLIAFE